MRVCFVLGTLHWSFGSCFVLRLGWVQEQGSVSSGFSESWCTASFDSADRHSSSGWAERPREGGGESKEQLEGDVRPKAIHAMESANKVEAEPGTTEAKTFERAIGPNEGKRLEEVNTGVIPAKAAKTAFHVEVECQVAGQTTRAVRMAIAVVIVEEGRVGSAKSRYQHSRWKPCTLGPHMFRTPQINVRTHYASIRVFA
jgi:hypothetical protein